MGRNQFQKPLTLAQRIRAAAEAARAFREARRRGAPISECIRLLDEWREAVRRMRGR